MLYLDCMLRCYRVDSGDLSFCLDLRSDPQVYDNLGTFIFSNVQSQKLWLEKINSDNSCQFLVVEKFISNKWHKIGLIRLSDIDHINKSALIGLDLHKDYRSKGFSKDIYALIFKICFDYWNMHRVWLLVMEYNEVARNLYKKIGFIEEGVQRNAIYRNGKYHNYLMMSMLKSEYEEKYEK